MARFRTRTISRRTVEALKTDRDTMFWDRELPGFGVRVHPSGRKVYVAQTRARGKAAKRVTVGVHGVLTAEEARRRAALIIARIKAGEEPVPEPMAVKLAEGPTVAEIAERYLEEHVAVRCKPKTASMYRLVVEKYIVPRLGKRPARAVGHKEVTELHHALSAKPIMANHVVDTLSRIYNAAEDRGQIPGGKQSLPTGGQVQGAQARAVPDRRGVPAARPGARRVGDLQGGFGARGGGHAPAAADRLPQGRDIESSLGPGGHGSRRAPPSRYQDRPQDDHPVAGSREGHVPKSRGFRTIRS